MKEEYLCSTLENKCPIHDFDVLGFTIPYEMSYTNVLNMIDLAKIPVLSKDRSDNDPIIISGGPCVYNAEPMCDLLMYFLLVKQKSLSVRCWN